MRHFFNLSLLILFALASYWLLEDMSVKQDKDPLTDKHFPDYFMESFTITSMNEQGRPEYILKAKKMLHFADDDDAELELPSLSLFQDDTEITLNADRAIFVEKEDTIYLYDNIVLRRAPSPTQSELSIYTDFLKIDSKSQIAETDKAARVVTADARLNTIGLVFNNTKGSLILKSQVKGIYETAD